MKEQPLVAGALGIALGALLGGLVPTSKNERQLARQAVKCDVGQSAVERSSEVLRSAKDKASSHIEKAGEVAREKVEEVKMGASVMLARVSLLDFYRAGLLVAFFAV